MSKQIQVDGVWYSERYIAGEYVSAVRLQASILVERLAIHSELKAARSFQLSSEEESKLGELQTEMDLGSGERSE